MPVPQNGGIYLFPELNMLSLNQANKHSLTFQLSVTFNLFGKIDGMHREWCVIATIVRGVFVWTINIVDIVLYFLQWFIGVLLLAIITVFSTLDWLFILKLFFLFNLYKSKFVFYWMYMLSISIILTIILIIVLLHVSSVIPLDRCNESK